MTGGAVNLNRFRKAKKRNELQATAVENRAKFGRTKAEKARDVAANEKLRRTVNGARRADDE